MFGLVGLQSREKLLKSVLDLIFAIDFPPGWSRSERRMVHLTQFCNLIAVASVLLYSGFYVLADWALLYQVALVNFAWLALFGASLWLNKHRRFNLAKVVFSLGLFASMFAATGVYIGKEPGIHFYFLLFALVPVLIWSFKDLGYILFFTAINLAGFIYVQFLFPENAAYIDIFPPNWILPLNIISIVAVYVTILAILAFLQYQSVQDVKVVEAQADDLRRLMNQFEELSRTDHLTELLNRRSLLELLRQEAARARRSQRPFSIIMCDVDYFKGINDRFGHDCGDFVLREVSRVMKDALRESDAVARWGGEEFCMLLPDTALPGALAMTERLRTAIEASCFVWHGAAIRLTLTFGIAPYRFQADAQATISEADRALYFGKAAGRNRVAVADLADAE
jgi:diguanylate cyclase (GGDEF)-like protein